MIQSIMNKKQVIRKIVISIGLPLLLGILLPVEARAQEAPAAKKESSGPMMRFLCLEELPVDGELVLATKGEEGEWLEQGPVSLRSSFITSWQKAAWGPLYLARRKGDDLEPIGSFILKEGVKRSIVVLMPGKK